MTTTTNEGTTMTTATTEKKTITITMSERRPINVDPSAWPVIAKADTHDGQVVSQANREWAIRVREHDDGRRLVYGWLRAGNGGAPIGWRGAEGGFLVESLKGEIQGAQPLRGSANEAETIRSIRRIGGIIGDDALADECIADLPAEEI